MDNTFYPCVNPAYKTFNMAEGCIEKPPAVQSFQTKQMQYTNNERTNKATQPLKGTGQPPYLSYLSKKYRENTKYQKYQLPELNVESPDLLRTQLLAST